MLGRRVGGVVDMILIFLGEACSGWDFILFVLDWCLIASARRLGLTFFMGHGSWFMRNDTSQPPQR